ncbi:PREDICTED: interferon regulatory factor 9 isoform X1 [Rhinopithecus bieti]|uniref:interferon regulatory factor 9 isoform X1 n=1 Tax=Rhinopithecus bieti TaxID=61621 RepID=UPI00083BB97B|nr:PREDICTED: interferon regulatory factor 9 isoform X1 [Rhinopithecus bieti]
MIQLRPCSGFPGSMQASRTSERTRMLPSSRPGQYLRESIRKGTQEAPLSGRLACAVHSTRVLNLRRFLRGAAWMLLSPTRCIGCCHQEPSMASQGLRNHHQSDSTVLCPLRGRRKRVPYRTAHSVLLCSRTPSIMRRRGQWGAVHSDIGSSSSSSPEPQEGTDTTEAPFQGDQRSLEFLLPPESDYSLLLTFIYNGRVVGEAQVQSLDCRLVAEPSGSESSMEQVLFPKPGPLEPTQRLLSQLERGILVASNPRGLFVQRLCPIPISWNAPQAPPGPGPHLLPSNECVELFRTAYFCRDLVKYFQGLGPPPKFQVTLNFWEESRGPSHTPQNLITVKMEQAFARYLLEETPEQQAAILSLV